MTPLAAEAVNYRDKSHATIDLVNGLKTRLEAAGEDYADSVNQCDVILRMFDTLSDAFIDLSVAILKADKGQHTAPQATPILPEGLGHVNDQQTSDQRQPEQGQELPFRPGYPKK